MWRLYLLGIIYLIMVLNIPQVKYEAINKVQIYSPKVTEVVTGIGDKYIPAASSLVIDLVKHSQTIVNGKLVDNVVNKPVDTSDNWDLSHKPSITADQFDNILREYNSPAVGVGAAVTAYADEQNIDNAYILYMFIHESTAGTAQGWAGNKGSGDSSHNPGNIRCYGDLDCYNGFVDYPDWNTGFKDMIDLLVIYRDKHGDKTIIEALDRWAPAFENNQNKDCDEQKRLGKELSYPCGLMDSVATWRQANQNIAQIKASNPTGKKHEVADGMHINANFDDYSCEAWGFQGCIHYGTDIAVCADCPVYAPYDCYYIMTGAYYDPARHGDYVMCTTTDGYEYYSGHLKNAIHLNAGDLIAAGTIIGYGNETVVGPHTHIQLRDPNGKLTDFMKYYQER